ncbi:MAG TPA: protein-L-isoaspartate(D-aspartate) O-methyltransferase [Bacteroidales bacterium]|nr:protein-L-isoaspartate(D-aspartate) O-methyltransferase [Bacteroidales bacterium]
MKDSFRHKGLRKKLIETIREKGITDENVLEAIDRVPRHLFMDSGFINHSYADKAFPIGAGQTISQPFTVAFQTQLIQPVRHQKILEIGTGSGYQSAVLLELGMRVYTIERIKELYQYARNQLISMGYKPNFHYGDGYKGLPAFAPFDRILVTAGAEKIPEKLIDQLSPGGRMVIPVGSKSGQKMLLIEKTIEEKIIKTEHGHFSFVPLVQGKL